MADTTHHKPLTSNQKLALGFGGVAAAIGLWWLVKPKTATASTSHGGTKTLPGTTTPPTALPPEKTFSNGGAVRIIDVKPSQPYYVIGDSGAAGFMKANPALIGNAMPGTSFAVIENAVKNAKDLIPAMTKTVLFFLGNDATDGTQTDITAGVVAMQKAAGAVGARAIFVVPSNVSDVFHGVLNQNAEYIIERPGEETTFDLVKSVLGLAPGQTAAGEVDLRVKRVTSYTDAAHFTADDGPVKNQDGTDAILTGSNATTDGAASAVAKVYGFYLQQNVTRFSVYAVNPATGAIVAQQTSPDWPSDVSTAPKLH